VKVELILKGRGEGAALDDAHGDIHGILWNATESQGPLLGVIEHRPAKFVDVRSVEPVPDRRVHREKKLEPGSEFFLEIWHETHP
jgi:hypothetical protein